MKTWQEEHRKVIKDFLTTLNKETNSFVLKGGTSLMMCYKLDRFSEDIDFDCEHQKLHGFIQKYTKENDFSFRIAKETPTVHRFLLNYGSEEKKLKIEISYRNKKLNSNFLTNIKGISVYTIDRICQQKAMAYQGRDKIRDLYDLSFICDKYFKDLSEDTKGMMRDALSYKGFEHFDYIISTQDDPLINKDKLADSYLKMYDKLDLLYTNDEVKSIQSSNRSL